MYRLRISHGAQRQIRRLSREEQQRILRAIESLKDDPRHPGSIKLSGGEGYRIRVGDYRVLFWIEDAEQTIEVYRVMGRENVYRGR